MPQPDTKSDFARFAENHPVLANTLVIGGAALCGGLPVVSLLGIEHSLAILLLATVGPAIMVAKGDIYPE